MTRIARRLAKALWFDGSGWCVLAKRLESGSFQLPAFDATTSQVQIDGAAFASLLAGIDFTLTADAEHRFNAVYASGDIIEAGCNAHGRRKFRDAEQTQPVLAAEGGAFIGAIYGEEQKAHARGLRGLALLEHRRAHIRPIANDFDRWRAAIKPTLLPSEPLMAAVQYYDRHRDALYRFIDDPAVPIDNSATEREFQNVAKLRLHMLFAGSTEGAHRACVLLGIMATCRALAVPAQAYLAWAFDRLGTHRKDFGLALEDMTGSRRHLDRALAHPEKPCVRRLPRARAHAPRAARQSTRPQVPSPQRFRAL